ncbi:MAG: NAD(P)H-dependent glycerol-3-phosphate dehydrogenase [Tenericutes bacterium]|nr:NAD(P)H-dependent glycerol-3-phosphate dehydrogenase [Mycoplasmatota bacterium]
MDKVVIIGGGSWGTALANLLIDNQKQVLIYDNDVSTVNEINNKHTNSSKLKNINLPKSLKATNDLQLALLFSDLIILAVPTGVVRIVLKAINKVLKQPKTFCNVSKGLEIGSHKRVSEIVSDEIESSFINSYITLSGPSHAEEVVQRKITSVVAASNDIEYAKFIQSIFSNNYFRVYTSIDLIGVELSGSLKNIFAIASGIVDGLGYGINTKAALITRGLIEMKRIAMNLGALEKTLDGLVGIGDLIVTCTTTLSRNYSAGVLIGKGLDLSQTLLEINMVVEGVKTCKSAYNLARSLNVETPIIDAVYNILYNDSIPKDEIFALMNRELRDE